MEVQREEFLTEARESENNSSLSERIANELNGGVPLEENVRKQLEAHFNTDLSKVRVHTNGKAHELAKSANATAFTTGQNIFFQTGKYNPNSSVGFELLAHETAHTIQQASGQVSPGIDSSLNLESEAKLEGQKAVGNKGNLEVQANSFNDFILKPNLETKIPTSRVQANVNNIQRSLVPSFVLQRDSVKSSTQQETPEIEKPTGGINKTGFIDSDDGTNIRSAPAELGGKTLTPIPLPAATRVFVSGTHPKKPDWLYVTASLSTGLVRGYVQGFRVNTNLPEPTATLFQVTKAEKLEPIAARIYRQNIKPGRDLRFYENAVLHVNQQFGRAGVYRGVDRKTGQESVMLQAGRRVWLVSPAFANTLEGSISSGSITGGAWAKAKEVGRHLEDILSSVTNSPQFFGEVAGEYRDAIMEHLPEIIGITAAFITAEALSAFLAATPTGVGQLAAAVIQLGLAAFGAKNFLDAGGQALTHASAWLTTAWTAKGDAKLLATASKEFLKMLVSIAMAALSLLGAKGNINKGLKIASGIKIVPPSIAMMPAMTPGGVAVGVPVFQPGSITAAPVAVSPVNAMAAVGAGGSKVKLTPAQEKRATELKELIEKNEPGSDEHRTARWELYQLTGGEWDYKRWLNTYEANLSKATTANAAVTAYQQKLGWGKTEVTVDAGGYPRRLDIADKATKRGIEIKEYQSGRISAAEDIRWEVARDKLLVADDWDILTPAILA